ncbi:hypothetical protein L249_7709, partial [Ophiocordyceps polyrhachis-furcata BCC 54312]
MKASTTTCLAGMSLKHEETMRAAGKGRAKKKRGLGRSVSWAGAALGDPRLTTAGPRLGAQRGGSRPTSFTFPSPRPHRLF